MNTLQDTPILLGKGEVESSILSRSTSFQKIFPDTPHSSAQSDASLRTGRAGQIWHRLFPGYGSTSQFKIPRFMIP